MAVAQKKSQTYAVAAVATTSGTSVVESRIEVKGQSLKGSPSTPTVVRQEPSSAFGARKSNGHTARR